MFPGAKASEPHLGVLAPEQSEDGGPADGALQAVPQGRRGEGLVQVGGRGVAQEGTWRPPLELVDLCSFSLTSLDIETTPVREQHESVRFVFKSLG